MHDRRLKYSIQGSSFQRIELLCLCWILLLSFHSPPPPFALHLSQLNSGFIIEVLSPLKNLPPFLCWDFGSDTWLHWYSIQQSNSCFSNQQPYSCFYIHTWHYFQGACMVNLWVLPCIIIYHGCSIYLSTWMERLALKSISTQAKIMGAIVSISGALLVVLYKGPTVILTTHSKSPQWSLGLSLSNWVFGGLLLIAQCLLLSIWYLLLTKIIKIYPAELVVTFLYNLGAALIAVPVCLVAEQDLSAWRLKPDRALASIVFAGFFGPSFSTLVHTWGSRLKGPLYVAIFKPLSIAIAAIMGFIFLGDALHLGSVIGAVIICIGFYAVLWGKANEEGTNGDSGITSLGASAHSKTPLLLSP